MRRADNPPPRGEHLSRQSRPRSFEPQVFGKYFLVDRIATGGMAEIFKAKTFSHGGFENLLVIKRILPHISDNADFVDMFIDEAKTSAALQHGNVVRVYDFGRIVDNYFIAMECVDGKDVRNILRKLARQRTYFPPHFVAFVAQEACKGLHYAHTKTDLHGRPYGIVHRDVSPSNILVSYDADVKIVDFGIAKARSNAYQTRDGMLKGKFEYMSSEQADGREIDHRSDLFSLGICMYEMMTNRRLFKTDNELATIRRIQACDFQPPRALNPDLPPELEAICLKALSRDPQHRYQNAQEMGEALRAFLFPATSEVLRHELRDFMREVFVDDVAEERRRLEWGTQVAHQLKDQNPDHTWDGDTRPSMTPLPEFVVTPPPTPRPRSRLGNWFAGFGVLLLGLAAVGLVGLGYYVMAYRPELADQLAEDVMAYVEAYVEMPRAQAPTGIAIEVQPAAGVIFVDGERHDSAKQLELEGLEPGLHTLRVEAPGFQPHEESVEVESGKVVKVNVGLRVEKSSQPKPRRPKAERPAPAEPATTSTEQEGTAAELGLMELPSDVEASSGEQAASGERPGTAEAAEPEVLFSSEPAGAVVRVDGREVGNTPMRWTRGSTGGVYSVEMVLDGHQKASGTLSNLRGGENSFALTLEPMPAKLAVLLLTGGWAHVYVDGTKLDKPAPLRGFGVAPGRHEIRVVNEDLGLDITERHDFSPGDTITMRIK